jgi:hypothetical protein
MPLVIVAVVVSYIASAHVAPPKARPVPEAQGAAGQGTARADVSPRA